MECWYDENGKEASLGRVWDPWDCLNYRFKIECDPGKVDYIVEADCMQCYFWCRCPCKQCNVVKFRIISPSLGLCGMLTRRGRDCLKNAILGNDADEFTVDFPKGSGWKQRAMLMNTVVFIDYTMFEDTSDTDKNAGTM